MRKHRVLAAALDEWQQFVPNDELALPPVEGKWLVPVTTWLKHRDVLNQRGTPVGLRVVPGDALDALSNKLEGLVLIAVDFPSFTDGRGFTAGRLLRTRLGWQGELRAIGDVLVDTVNYLARCGFDSFVLKEGHGPDAASAQLHFFHRAYQQGYGSLTEQGESSRAIRRRCLAGWKL